MHKDSKYICSTQNNIDKNNKTVEFVEPKGDNLRDLLAALELYKGISFFSRSESVFLNSYGVWTYKEFADTDCTYTLRSIVFEEVEHLQGRERIEEKKRIYSTIFRHVPNLTLDSVGRSSRTSEETPKVQKENIYTSEYSKEFLQYFEQKGGIAEATLQLCNVAQLLSRGGFQYAEPVAIYPNKQVCKLTAQRGEFRRFSVPETTLKPAIFGLFGHEFANGKKTLVFEGETDTLLAVELGFSALCLGGVAKAKELLSMSCLQTALVFFGDFDTEGERLNSEAQKKGFQCIAGESVAKALGSEYEYLFYCGVRRVDKTGTEAKDLCELYSLLKEIAGSSEAAKNTLRNAIENILNTL